LFSIRPMRHFPIFVLLVMAGFMSAATAGAASPGPVGRGTAGNFAVLGGSTVTNTGASVLTGDLGLSPGTSITGFPPGVVHGAVHRTDDVALQAKQDLVTAYDDAAGRASNATISADLGGRTLTPGVYRGASSLQLTGSLTLDGQGDPNAVFIFQAPSTLITGSASDVILIGAAQACNVVWQVGSSATLGTGSSFTGNILALQSITLNHGATVDGSTLARNAAVTLDQNTISRAVCSDGSTSGTTGPGGGTTATTGPGGGTSATTGPGAGTTATTGPGGGTTATTGPGGGTRTDTQTDTETGTPPVVPLASTGAGHATGRALSGLAMAGLGLTILRITRRRPVR